ncbi:hypothetical protein MAM1_0249c08708 [Mucor ambiguus]|uniref:Uncharacterized protein n=1 Tax=Mucor ambiguus TaxID=91626 RepID=A0A0C9MET9_9FUNG|nr:hypothetical protein MAM1_0249c08708 [Mucor ambiguus]
MEIRGKEAVADISDGYRGPEELINYYYRYYEHGMDLGSQNWLKPSLTFYPDSLIFERFSTHSNYFARLDYRIVILSRYFLKLSWSTYQGASNGTKKTGVSKALLSKVEECG